MARAGDVATDSQLAAFWCLPPDRLYEALKSGPDGLGGPEAARRLGVYGPNSLAGRARHVSFGILLSQLRSPLVLILVFAAMVSLLVGDYSDGLIIGFIVLGSAFLSFYQEYRATAAVEALRSRVSQQAIVIRDGIPCTIPASEIVPGDIFELKAGDLVPADSVLIEARELHVVQSALTGESFPVQKSPQTSAKQAGLSERLNVLFMGTSIRSGTARAIAVVTGRGTEFGAIASELEREEGETAFSQGIRRFGYLMSQAMFAIVLVVFAVNIALDRHLLDSLMFSVALAVGLTPQMLPAIISVTLSSGARRMAAQGVIVKRLGSIENLGSMDVLCTDKTGTISVGVVKLTEALSVNFEASERTMFNASLNATFQAGLNNPMDDAIVEASKATGADLSGYRKVDEIPYDFTRKRLAVVVEQAGRPGTRSMIVKGAFDNVVSICTHCEDGDTVTDLDVARLDVLRRQFEAWGSQGYRVLAVAARPVPDRPAYGRDDERDMVLLGFLLFSDPPKPDAKLVLNELRRRGVATKVITGDNRYVATHLAGEVGLNVKHILTGSEIAGLTHEALVHRVRKTDLFAEVDPNQKERIVNAFRQAGHVVGYLGDGINDATALKSADIGISVDQAVDVAKEAADMVLMQRDLNVLCAGIDDGRKIFANTMKYISITTSANFGNMISMAVASMFLPFLPLLAKQILLNNFLSDIPALAIADDNVDSDMIARPHHWDISYIRQFMIIFGLISSVFDFLTFGLLFWVFHANEAVFQTGWFMESLITELLVLFVIRTRKPFFRSNPGRLLLVSSAVVTALAILLPYLPFAADLGFRPLPLALVAMLLAIVVCYVVVTELAKSRFFAWQAKQASRHIRRVQIRSAPASYRRK